MFTCRRQAARLGGAVQEAAHDREQFRLFEQEGVMALVGHDLGERDARAGGVERMHDGARFRRREQPVRGERDHAEARLRAAEGIGHHAVVVGGEIEIVHRARQIEIRIGVEALDERAALVAQIGFDLEVGVERERRIVAVLELAAELAMQRGVREIGDVRAHARDGEPAARGCILGKIAAVAPFRIGHHRLTADLVEGDVLRRVPRRAGDRQRREHALRIARRPLQHLHAAHRAAGHREQRVDAKIVEQHRLRAHHVADGDDGKVEAPRLAGLGIGRGRAGRAHAAADHVRADDEIALGVDRLAGTDHGFPPAGLAGHRIDARDMLIAGERVTDQHGIGALGVERAVGLVGDLERRKLDAGIELQRIVGAEPRDQRIARRVGLAGARRGIGCCIDVAHVRVPAAKEASALPGG